MGNLKAKCPKSEWPLIKAKLDRIYYAGNLMEAKAQAERFTQKYRAIFPPLVDCLEKDLDACLAYMSHPANRWKHIRTTNLIERSFKEVKRRVKVMEQFPTEESCIRILFTLLQAQNEVWEGQPIKHFENYTNSQTLPIPWDTLNEDLGGHRAVLKPHSMQLPTVEPAKEILATLIP